MAVVTSKEALRVVSGGDVFWVGPGDTTIPDGLVEVAKAAGATLAGEKPAPTAKPKAPTTKTTAA